MNVKSLLRELDLGNSVAEFDDSLERYFVETEAFRALAYDRSDLIAGEKGTGKTALYRVFKKRYPTVRELPEVEVVAAFNPSGNPVFQRLAYAGQLTEGQYITIWKAYLVSLVGNWVLQLYETDLTEKMRELDHMLVEVGLRSRDESAETILSKLVNALGRLKPRSAEIGFSFSEAGMPVATPRLDFGDDESSPDVVVGLVPHEPALKLLNETLAEVKLSAWVALDRLDEAFQGFRRFAHCLGHTLTFWRTHRSA